MTTLTDAKTPHRLEAFSDGVLAIIITIMVLELRAPSGHSFSDWNGLFPKLIAYLASFIFLSIYWNNHHHLMRATKQISGGVMWANMHLLFWLSLIPIVTSWIGEDYNYLHTSPVIAYGIVAFMAAAAFAILVQVIKHLEPNIVVAEGIKRDKKGLLSNVIYAVGMLLAVFGLPLLGIACYLSVSVMWLIPDRRVAQ
jgi:uncharacterized membrane protein